MVADQHRLADGEILAKTARGVGQHDGARARSARGAHRMHDVAQLVSLVGVDPADEHQHPVVADAQRQHLAAVSCGGRRGEAGQLGHRHDGHRIAELQRRRAPSPIRG